MRFSINDVLLANFGMNTDVNNKLVFILDFITYYDIIPYVCFMCAMNDKCINHFCFLAYLLITTNRTIKTSSTYINTNAFMILIRYNKTRKLIKNIIDFASQTDYKKQIKIHRDTTFSTFLSFSYCLAYDYGYLYDVKIEKLTGNVSNFIRRWGTDLVVLPY